jgi:hypothetical protein
MNINFAQAQAEALADLSSIGESKDKFETFIADNILKQYAKEFQLALEKFLNDRKVVGSGRLRDSINPEFKEDGTGFTISMLDYYDYPNEGVAGIDFNRNALGSPYSFKKSKGYYAISNDGRESLKEYITSGRAKVSNVKKPIGLERKKISGGKKKSLIDMQVDQLVYQIRKHGIKRTDYFNDAFETVFANFSEDMAKAYGKDVALNLRLISSKNK